VAFGCKTVVSEGPAPGMKVDDPRAPQATIQYNTVVILDKSLQGNKAKLAVENTNSRRTQSGTLEVWAVIRNRTDFQLQIEARAQFFNAEQTPSEGPTAWQRIFLPPQSVQTYREYSTKINEISYYYIEVREGR
jgi:hypothetical protein